MDSCYKTSELHFLQSNELIRVVQEWSLNRSNDHCEIPLIWFLYTLVIVLRYLMRPVPVPFLCCVLTAHPVTASTSMYICEVEQQDTHMLSRYVSDDDKTSFHNVCTMCGFWYVVFRMMVYLDSTLRLYVPLLWR